jgi:hypothetical protein
MFPNLWKHFFCILNLFNVSYKCQF